MARPHTPPSAPCSARSVGSALGTARGTALARGAEPARKAACGPPLLPSALPDYEAFALMPSGARPTAASVPADTARLPRAPPFFLRPFSAPSVFFLENHPVETDRCSSRKERAD